MNKKTKKILFSILGVVIIIVGIVIAVDCSKGDTSGTVVTSIQESPYDYED